LAWPLAEANLRLVELAPLGLGSRSCGLRS